MTDPKGWEKYQEFLVGAKTKLKEVEHSLGQLAGQGIIDEADFASPLSDARRMVEVCYAGGWSGFNRQGSGYFGTAVNLEVTLRSITYSLGDHMI